MAMLWPLVRLIYAGWLGPQPNSETDLVASFQRQYFPRLVGRCDLQAKPFDDLSNLRHLVGIRLCELAGADPQAVFETDADIPAHGGRHRRDRHLGAAGAEHGPAIVLAEQPVRGAHRYRRAGRTPSG